MYLKDLRKLYQDRLKCVGASEDIITNVNVMRLKEDLQEIPGFLEQRNGRCVVITIADELGKGLVECSQNTLKVDGFILPKATRIVRKSLFEVFHGEQAKIICYSATFKSGIVNLRRKI